MGSTICKKWQVGGNLHTNHTLLFWLREIPVYTLPKKYMTVIKGLGGLTSKHLHPISGFSNVLNLLL